jgi:hypothetical protein
MESGNGGWDLEGSETVKGKRKLEGTGSREKLAEDGKDSVRRLEKKGLRGLDFTGPSIQPKYFGLF